MSHSRIYTFTLPLIFLLIFVAVFFPAFVSISSKWLQFDEYTHAFLTLPVIVYIGWRKRKGLCEENGSTAFGLPLFVASVLMYVFALMVQIPTLIYLSTFLTIVGVIVYIFGIHGIKMLFVPLLLFFLLIPVPSTVLSTLTSSLQLRVSEISSVIIHAFNIPLLREGNILQLPEKSFHVIDACSGIRSLIAMTTLSIIIGYFALNRTISKLLLVVSSLPVALLINIMRVVILVIAYYYMNIDLTSGWLHDVFGLAIFCAGVILLFGFYGVLQLWEEKHTPG